MKKLIYCLLIVLISCSEKKWSRGDAHATTVLYRKYELRVTTSPEKEAKLNTENKDIESIDSIIKNFTATDLIQKSIDSIKDSRYTDPVFIRERMEVEQTRYESICINVYVDDPEFACRFLNILVDLTLDRLKQRRIRKLETISKGLQKSVDSCFRELKLMADKIEKPGDEKEKKIFLGEYSLLMQKTNDLKKRYDHARTEFPETPFYIISRATWVRKKNVRRIFR